MADFIDRLGQACARAEYEFPRLAAPDGTVAVQITDLRHALTALSAKPAAAATITRLEAEKAALVEALEVARPYVANVVEAHGHLINKRDLTQIDTALATLLSSGT